MPNLKISQLTELATTPVANDLLAIVDTSVFPIETKKIKYSTLFGGSWALTGNAGTVAGTNFIGTTDAIDFVVKTNNVERLRVASQGDSYINGVRAGLGLAGVATNTVFGFEALNANTTGGVNTAVGYRALKSNTSAVGGTAVGDGALQSNTTGQVNTAIGSQALNANTTGQNNTGLGRNALTFNTTGSSNTGNGTDTLALNTTGSNNTAIGLQALYSNVTGSNAVAIGHSAMLFANSTAVAFTNSNTAIGFEAYRGSVTAANNTGNRNTVVGYKTLNVNTTGESNVALGYQALIANTTGSNNLALGASTGSNVTTGSTNTFVGYNTGLGITTGSENTVLGANVTGLGAALSNNIIIADGAGTVRIQVDNTGAFSFTGTAVTVETLTSNETWEVFINGVSKKILLRGA
jgi:trimeric autotransporter adhesin